MSDTRTIVFSIIGTGIATITIIVSFVAIVAGGINNRIDDVNDSIDDVNMNVNSRIDDVNANVNSRIDDVNARIDDIHTRIDDLQNDIRELRSLAIDALKGDAPPDD